MAVDGPWPSAATDKALKGIEMRVMKAGVGRSSVLGMGTGQWRAGEGTPLFEQVSNNEPSEVVIRGDIGEERYVYANCA